MFYILHTITFHCFIILAFGNAKTHIHGDASRFVSNLTSEDVVC